MNPLDKSALFERASRRASLRPEYLGWVLVRYADAERKTDEELAELLAASMQDLPRLRLCLCWPSCQGHSTRRCAGRNGGRCRGP